jgi:hypothetical protein
VTVCCATRRCSARLRSVMSCTDPNMRRGRPDSSPRYIALTVDESHLAVGPHHSVLHIVALAAAPKRLCLCLNHHLPIFRMDKFR